MIVVITDRLALDSTRWHLRKNAFYASNAHAVARPRPKHKMVGSFKRCVSPWTKYMFRPADGTNVTKKIIKHEYPASKSCVDCLALCWLAIGLKWCRRTWVWSASTTSWMVWVYCILDYMSAMHSITVILVWLGFERLVWCAFSETIFLSSLIILKIITCKAFFVAFQCWFYIRSE